MQCRNCGLRFNITWHNFAKMLKKLEGIENGERRGDLRKDKLKRLGTLVEQVEILKKYVDVNYTSRKPPRKAQHE